MEKINDTPIYFNQYFDVTDLPDTLSNEKYNTCNVSCLGMITNLHPDVILNYMFNKYGKNNKYQWEENIVQYLTDNGYIVNPVTAMAWPYERKITDEELTVIRNEIDKGNVILYHKSGHYQLLIGYVKNDNKIDYVFNDPAGDRKLPREQRESESGHKVVYSYGRIKSEPLYGRSWAVNLK